VSQSPFSPDRVRFRAARPDDADVLRRWDEEPDVDASGGDDDGYDWDRELPRSVPWREMVIAEVDAVPAGVFVIIDAAEEESHYWGEVPPGTWAVDIWIGDAANRSRGLGRVMMSEAVRRCIIDHGALDVLIDPLVSNTRALAFYHAIGFEEVGPRTFGDDDCLVMRWVAGRSEELPSPP